MITFDEIIDAYGPYLGLILMLQVSFMVMQFRWFRRVVKVKDQEIERLVLREEEINKRLIFIIDQRINYSERASTNVQSEV
jgi:hypothetical protein